MKSKHPRCGQCRNPLGVRAGIIRESKPFCNSECAYLYFGPPEPVAEEIMARTLFDQTLERLKKQNPRANRTGLLALYYLQWERIPGEGSEDYKIYQSVREWCIEP